MRDRLRDLWHKITSWRVSASPVQSDTSVPPQPGQRQGVEAEPGDYQEHLEELVRERTAELRESEERYRTLFDRVPVGLYRTTPTGQILDANPAVVQMLAYPSREELLAANVNDLLVDRTDTDAERKVLHRDGVSRAFEHRHYRYDGEIIWVSDTVRTVTDEDGKLLCYEGMMEDISERKEAEAELGRYRGHLEELVGERTVELRRSEERYRTLFDGVPVGLYRSTPVGETIDANLALVQMMGYSSREEFLEVEAASKYVNPEDRARWTELMEREGVLRGFEVEARRGDGTAIWVKDTARAVRDEQGQVLYYEGSLEDITERKRTEAELRKYQEQLEELVEERTAELGASEERYRTLFDGVPVALYRTTPSGRVLDLNRAMAQMFGFSSRDDALGVTSEDVYVDPEDRKRWTALMEREGIVRDFEAQVRHRDGTVMWISDSARIVKDEQGQVLYYEGSLEDITDRKRFEEELRRQKDYFEALFVNSPVAVVTADLDGAVVSWNPMAEKLFGYTQDEAIGKELDSLIANDDSIRAEAARYSREVLTAGRVQVTTKRMRKDGSLVDVDLLALPLVVAEEKTGFIAIYHDITDLQEARREAEAANQAKSTFLANMSHELRTPLNAIIGFTRLVKRRSKEVLPQKQIDNLDKVLVSADHLLEQINGVLDLSKIEAGRIDVQPAAFDVVRLVDQCLETVQPLVIGEQLRLTKEIEPDLPPLFTDQDKVRQILINLLSNGIKFTEKGTISVGARQKGRVLELSVADTGIGIPEEAVERIFEAFQQVDESTTRKYGGTGLGLSISRHLARLLGGDVTVKSTVGVGSTFTARLPVRYSVPSRTTAAPFAEPQPEETRSLAESSCVVLVIDDDPNVVELLREDLAEAGFGVIGATGGDEGLQQVRAAKPFAIILDIMMSPKDGWQVLHELKTDPVTREIPVVVLSIVDNKELGYRLGAYDYLVKPFDREAILSVLRRIAVTGPVAGVVDLLVVDDDQQVIDLVRQLLEGEDYEVRAAGDGQQALETISQQCPDVILLDLLMPRMDGFGLIERLRHGPQSMDIPIIVLTAKELSQRETEQLERRVSKVIRKHSLEREVLLRELRSALEAYRRRPALKGRADEEDPGGRG